MHNISLYPNKDDPTAYYLRIRTETGEISKLFKFNHNQPDALFRARVYRLTLRYLIWGAESLDKEVYITNSGVKRKATIYRQERENRSGILGVSYQEKPANFGGKRKMWVAAWRENGKLRLKSFTFDGEIGASKIRTSDEAKLLASQHRKRMEAQHYKK